MSADRPDIDAGDVSDVLVAYPRLELSGLTAAPLAVTPLAAEGPPVVAAAAAAAKAAATWACCCCWTKRGFPFGWLWPRAAGPMRRRAAAGLSWAAAAAAAFSRRRELGSAMKAAEGLNTWPPAAPGPEKVEKENVENIPKQKTDRQGLIFICLISVLLFSIIALMEIY